MSLPALAPMEADRSGRRKVSAGEALLLIGSVLSLVAACVLWSARKQAWMDEILTWKEVGDRSLWHLYWAVQHGADGGQPLFYTTVWFWAKVFGASFLSLRLYSCAAMCAALVVTWRTIRRSYGMWATAFGVLCVWGTSGLLLDENAEARFYGLYVLAVAITLCVYVRLAERREPGRRLLWGAFFSQAALALTHILGILYGGVVLVALVILDRRRRWFRPKVYLSYATGWLALLVWIPAIRASAAAGRPRGWILPPHLRDLSFSYGMELGWELLIGLHQHWPRIFHPAVYHLPELFVAIVLLAVVFCWRSLRGGEASDPAIIRERGALLLAAFAMLTMPLLLFALSRLATPVLVPRYVLPGAVGLAVLIAAFADALGADTQLRTRTPRLGRLIALLLLLVFPACTVVTADDFAIDTSLDVRRVERDLPPNAIVVVGWQEDFSRMMRFAGNPARYFFLLDWTTAVDGARGFVLDYHLMRAFRQAGYFASNIQDQSTFFCSHPSFYVLDQTEEGWFNITVRKMPEFAWTRIDTIKTPNLERSLYRVRRVAPLPFCEQVRAAMQQLNTRKH